jgi:hypothetical protein
MFVVLGLTARPPAEDSFIVGNGAPPGWGMNAVVCDPWYHEWFGVADWKAKIPFILSEAIGSKVFPGAKCKLECRAYI